MIEPFAGDRDWVFVDLETTGGHASRHRIIEIGLVQVDRQGGVEEWSTLVNPGLSIPSGIEAFTGISNEMVANAPSFEQVHRELLGRLAGRIFVAHNARFDYGFIRSELLRLDVRFTAKVLCTVKLSRRLFPEHPRHNLDAVMARHGVTCAARHRALGDARVLRELMIAWTEHVGATRLQTTIDEILKETVLPPQLPAELADDLPESPGVYRLFGESDALLYVGKSRNIRHRVLEHFAATHRSSAEARLARLVRRVSWRETTGELGALLLECQAIKAEQPVHNRRLRQTESAWTVVLDSVDAAPARLVIHEIDALSAEQRREAYGLYKDRRSAQHAMEEIARAHGLCAQILGLERGAGAVDRGGSCFAFQIKRCRGVCVGEEAPALHDTRVRLALAGLRLREWPYRGRVVVDERDWRDEHNYYVLDQWCYLGTVREPEEAASLRGDDVRFDADIYRILKRFFATPGSARIIEVPRA